MKTFLQTMKDNYNYRRATILIGEANEQIKKGNYYVGLKCMRKALQIFPCDNSSYTDNWKRFIMVEKSLMDKIVNEKPIIPIFSFK